MLVTMQRLAMASIGKRMGSKLSHQFNSVQSLSRVRLFATPWITARQASLSITNSRSLPKLRSIESVMPSNHLIFCHPLFLPNHSKSIIYLKCYVLSMVYHIWTFSLFLKGFPSWLSGKEFICQCRRCRRHKFYSRVRKIPWKRKWQPTLLFLPGKFRGQRSLAGYSPWGWKKVRNDWAHSTLHRN